MAVERLHLASYLSINCPLSKPHAESVPLSRVILNNGVFRSLSLWGRGIWGPCLLCSSTVHLTNQTFRSDAAHTHLVVPPFPWQQSGIIDATTGNGSRCIFHLHPDYRIWFILKNRSVLITSWIKDFCDCLLVDWNEIRLLSSFYLPMKNRSNLDSLWVQIVFDGCYWGCQKKPFLLQKTISIRQNIMITFLILCRCKSARCVRTLFYQNHNFLLQWV